MGSFIGHAIPGIFLLYFGIYFTIQAMVAMRKNPSSPRSLSKQVGMDWLLLDNPKHMILVLICASIGIIFEWPNVIPGVSPPLETGLAHITLYAGFVVFSVATLLQKKSILPETSSTVALAVINGLLANTWYAHAAMKNRSTDVMVHRTQGLVTFLTCFFIFTTLVASKGYRAFVLISGACFSMQGMWLLAIAFMFFKWRGGHISDPDQKKVNPHMPIVAFSWCVYTLMFFYGLVYVILRRFIKPAEAECKYEKPPEESEETFTTFCEAKKDSHGFEDDIDIEMHEIATNSSSGVGLSVAHED
mmetsp:Transcript_15279/g.27469  ORF Transcript_15279/g.27469 Transcript_15279/m.27469 type:complete len:303 (-) Transcript_15279:372-1280(-)